MSKTTEIAAVNSSPIITGDVAHGGLTGQDLEIPRAVLLQKTSPDVEENKDLSAGQYINSITKEVLKGRFIPLFAFKQYAKFNTEGNLEWTTVNRNDPRVVAGLQWVAGNRPEVTEFLNVMVVFAANPDIPLVLSFKSTSLRVGKQFMTLASMKGKPMHHFWYEIDTKLVTKGTKSWYIPVIRTPSTKKEHDAKPGEAEKYAAMAKVYQPLVANITVEENGSSDKIEDSPF